MTETMRMRLETITEANVVDNDIAEMECVDYKSRRSFYAMPAISNTQIMELILENLPQNEVSSSHTDTATENAPMNDSENTIGIMSMPSQNFLESNYGQNQNTELESPEHITETYVLDKNSNTQRIEQERKIISGDKNVNHQEQTISRLRHQVNEAHNTIKRLQQELRFTNLNNERYDIQLSEMKSETELVQVHKIKLERMKYKTEALTEEVELHRDKLRLYEEAVKRENEIEEQLIALKYQLVGYQEKADYDTMYRSQLLKEIYTLQRDIKLAEIGGSERGRRKMRRMSISCPNVHDNERSSNISGNIETIMEEENLSDVSFKFKFRLGWFGQPVENDTKY